MVRVGGLYTVCGEVPFGACRYIETDRTTLIRRKLEVGIFFVVRRVRTHGRLYTIMATTLDDGLDWEFFVRHVHWDAYMVEAC